MNRTLVVGWDAACWEYLNPLLESDRLPALQKLMRSGTWGSMQSTMPPWTPTAWASIITGKNPGKHGVFDMLARLPGTYEAVPTNAHFRQGRPFWEYLNRHGVRVGLVNVPFAYPCGPLDGFFVAGFGSPNSAADLAHPPEALAWIEQNFGSFQPDLRATDLEAASPAALLQLERDHQSRQIEIASALAERYRVDVLVINLMLPDHANHKMPTMDLVEEAYCQTDKDLNNLIESFRPDNVLLISDHGSSRVKGDFLLNVWLRDHGYYVQAETGPSERAARLNWILLLLLQRGHGWGGLPERLLRRVARGALSRLPKRLTGRLWTHIEKTIPFAREHVRLSGRPDYARTRVFSGSVYGGLLYLNLAGREPTGVVALEDKAGLAAEIRTRLAGITDPETGQPLFPRVYTAADLYSGPAIEAAPDLILDREGTAWNIHTGHYGPAAEPQRDRYFVDVSQRQEFGWHSRTGIFVFSGAGFSRGQSPAARHVMDIPATLLHLYGAAVPEDYDGQVAVDLMAANLRWQPIRLQPGEAVSGRSTHQALSDRETREVTDRLRALGYLH